MKILHLYTQDSTRNQKEKQKSSLDFSMYMPLLFFIVFLKLEFAESVTEIMCFLLSIHLYSPFALLL